MSSHAKLISKTTNVFNKNMNPSPIAQSNPDIAIILEIKVCTVKKHLENIYHKLGVENRTSALLMAIEDGIDKPIKKGH
jgi:hypothetical protein